MKILRASGILSVCLTAIQFMSQASYADGTNDPWPADSSDNGSEPAPPPVSHYVTPTLGVSSITIPMNPKGSDAAESA